MVAARVYRDSYGIPHLRAGSVQELAWLQGRNVAADRAWQLEWNRHRAEGRTAELIGSPGLIFDRFARRARIGQTARRCYDRLDEATRQWCAAFTEGVNAGLPAGALGAYEFARLDTSPGRWQPWTPLAVFWVQQLLFGGFGYKLWRRHVADRLGQQVIALMDTEAVDAPGSNAWGVRGDRTRSGMPMIAGDPHRSVDFPGVYQQVRLACPDFDVIGFSFPGVPGIQHFGHTGEVAWAITNAMADYQDLYLEELRRDGDRISARGPAGWQPVARSDELIEVRGAAPEPVEILITERGPVIIDRPAISLRTPAAVEDDLGFGALLPLLRARSADDVETALRAWVEPVNSVLVADRSGDLRHLVAGRVPLRDRANLDLPVPAWDARYSWTGDYAAMPVETVPDLVANGNDRASGGGLGAHYAPGWRAHRIRDLLLTGITERGADASTMACIHRDVWLGPARAAQDLIRGVAVDEPAAAIKAELLGWDGGMEADSGPALLYATWRSALVDWICRQPPFGGLLDPDPLPEVYAAWMNPRSRIGVAFDAICRNADRLGLDLPAGVRAALEAVAAEPPDGSWGDAHRLAPLHGLTGLAGECVPPMPAPRLAGDANCVWSTHSSPGITHRCSMASMARYVWDLDDRSASRWVVPFGASGRPGDPHHVDQTDAWAAGELLPIVTDWDLLVPDPG